MKINVSSLRSLIAEALEDGFIQLPEDEMRQVISAMDPDEVATKNYYDSETGEVYLEPGEKARSSILHPQGELDRRERDDAERAARDKEWEAEDAELAAYDAEQDRIKDTTRSNASVSFGEALDEFVANWEDDPTLEPGVEHDAAETFFDAYPEATNWAKSMGMSVSDMKSTVMDILAGLSR